MELKTLSSDSEDAMNVVDDVQVHVHVGRRKKHIISLIALPNSLYEIYLYVVQ